MIYNILTRIYIYPHIYICQWNSNYTYISILYTLNFLPTFKTWACTILQLCFAMTWRDQVIHWYCQDLMVPWDLATWKSLKIWLVDASETSWNILANSHGWFLLLLVSTHVNTSSASGNYCTARLEGLSIQMTIQRIPYQSSLSLLLGGGRVTSPPKKPTSWRPPTRNGKWTQGHMHLAKQNDAERSSGHHHGWSCIPITTVWNQIWVGKKRTC